MKTRAVCAVLLLLVMGCCVLLAACESLGGSAADVSSGTEPSSTTTTLSQVDDELVGIWSGLGDESGEAVMLDSDGRIFFFDEDPEDETMELAYRVEDNEIIIVDEQGRDVGSVGYSVGRDGLKITDPASGAVAAYDYVKPANTSGQKPSAQAVQGRWELGDEEGYVDLAWEFYEDGTCRQMAFDPLTEGYVYFNYDYEIEGDILRFYDDEGVEVAPQVIGIGADSLTMTNIFNPDIEVTLDGPFEAEGPTTSTEEDLYDLILGTWEQAGEQAHHHHHHYALSAWTFNDDGTCIQAVWNPETKAYDPYEYTYGIEGNILTFYDEEGMPQAAQRIKCEFDEDGNAVALTMVNIYDPEIVVTFDRVAE